MMISPSHTIPAAPMWMVTPEMSSCTLDLDRRTVALIELLDCPVRWASREYMVILSDRFIATCTRQDRQDLAKRIMEKVESVGLE